MLYLDTSFVIPLVLPQSPSPAITRFISDSSEVLVVSHWTRVEMSGVLARETRMETLSQAHAIEADAQFERIARKSFQVISSNDRDFQRAKAYIQNYATGLRAPDALHLAIAANRNATRILTLDKGLLKAGRLLGLPMSSGPFKG